MNRDELLTLLATEEVINLMMELGSEYPIPDHQNNYYFTTICHCGDSHKLLYYTDSKMFFCYTSCGSMSIYDVISRALDIDFGEAYKYLANYKGINLGKRRVGLRTAKIENEDLDFLNVHLYKPTKNIVELPKYSENVLQVFNKVYPIEWYNEGINEEVAEFYDIRYYYDQNKCIIPHRDILGNLVGIRARNFNQSEIDRGMKYIPITLQGLTYRYPMSHNLFGIYQNQESIKRHRRVVIFESEKSVLLASSMYGQDNNITVALCSMNMSLYQRDLLLSTGVSEVVFCLDKQYTLECLETKEGKEYQGFVSYIKKLKKLTSMFMNYCHVSVVLCWDERIDYKDSPIDKGKEVFEELMNERYLVTDINEFDNLIN